MRSAEVKHCYRVNKGPELAAWAILARPRYRGG